MEFDLDWHRMDSEVWPEVAYELRPLRVWAFLELMEFWEGRPNRDGDAEAAMRVSAADSLRLMEVARRIFPDHVRNLTGVTLRKSGAVHPACAEDLCDEAPLLPLAGEIISKLVALADITVEAEKN